MATRADRLIPILRACLDAIRADDRGRLIAGVGSLTPVMSLLYSTPPRIDARGNRAADHGAGEALLYCRQLRQSVAELPTHSGLGGVVWDATWILGMLDYCMLLLER